MSQITFHIEIYHLVLLAIGIFSMVSLFVVKNSIFKFLSRHKTSIVVYGTCIVLGFFLFLGILNYCDTRGKVYEKQKEQRNMILETLTPEWKEVVVLLNTKVLESYEKYKILKNKSLTDSITVLQFEALSHLINERCSDYVSDYDTAIRGLIVPYLNLKETP